MGESSPRGIIRGARRAHSYPQSSESAPGTLLSQEGPECPRADCARKPPVVVQQDDLDCLPEPLCSPFRQ